MAIPGLPALADDVIIDAVSLITQDVLSILGSLGGPQWGLFLNGEPAVVSDNVVSFEFKQDFRISNYPVEEGAFESYNKVQVPFDVRLRFSTGGSVADRQAMIDSVDAIIGSTDLFDAVTPEKVYQSVNPTHQDIRRTSRNGVGLLVIDVYCEQVRVTATQQFTTSQQSSSSSATTSGNSSGLDVTIVFPGSQINQPQAASAAPQVSNGTVQTTTAAPGQFDLSQALP
jgi:hypothetical protein